MLSKVKNLLPLNQSMEMKVDLAFLTVLVCGAYVLSEWLFIITKPSFLNDIGRAARLFVLLESFLGLSAIAIALLMFIVVLESLFHLSNKNFAIKVGKIIPALISAGMILLLVDNFTYTVFGFGIVTAQGVFRGAYALLFLFCVFLAYRYLNRWLPLNFKQPQLKIAFIVLIFVGALVSFLFYSWSKRTTPAEINLTGKIPNIILIGSDGMNADNMSVYGYDRETTPNIEKFAEQSLIVENNFSNSSNTSGSLISILTSKHPTQTRMLYPPDYLQGEDAYQHLPGILKQAGYYNVELAAPHFADAYTLGMLYGFDEVNGRSAKNNVYFKLIDFGLPNTSAYFVATLFERISSRILHILFIAEMKNPYDLVTKNAYLFPDKEKLGKISDLLDQHKDRPVFIHAHFMGTHGKLFSPEVQKFSTGLAKGQPWNREFYDDSIYNFDLMFGKLIKRLERRNLLDNTVIILYSDHGMAFNSNKRVPLIIRFPDATQAGKRIKIGQNLDIAPTVLDYLGINPPAWMDGNSLLQNNTAIISVISTGSANNILIEGQGWMQNELHSTPPFYQFDYINVINCHKWLRLDLEAFEWSTGVIENFVHPCTNQELLTTGQVIEIMSDRLSNDAFDIPADFLNGEKITAISMKYDALQEKITPEERSSFTNEPESPAEANWEYPQAGWNPLVAHGFGAWEDTISPNNYEAFLESYEEGFRNFEVDIMMSSNGIPLAAHDRMEKRYYGLDKLFSDYTAAEFLTVKLNNSGKTLSGPDILQLLEEYKDIRIVFDLKVQDRTKAIGWFLNRLPKSQWPRVLTNVQTEGQIKGLLQEFPDYRGAFLQLAPWNEDRIIDDAEAMRLVTQYDMVGVFTWVHELDPNLNYIENNAQLKRWTPKLAQYMAEADKAVILHTTDDPELIEIRRAAGAAIITNNAIPQPTPQRVVLISVDGLRPEMITKERMPHLTSLMKNGAYTLAAQTILPSLTLPAHTSMLTGLCPSEHGITWNEYKPENGYSKGPDLFELADAAGLRTAMVVGKTKLRQITEPENTDLFKVVTGGDQKVAYAATEIINNGFELLFIHFPSTDILGHEYGWMSVEQLANMEETDRALGTIVETLKETGRQEDTLIIVTADHGGHDKYHGSDLPEDMTVPWIISGFEVISQQLSNPINVTDTAPTIAYAIGIQIPPEWDGHPVFTAFGIDDNLPAKTICR